MRTITLHSFDSTPLSVRVWEQTDTPTGVILLCHDAFEHSGRHASTAQAWCDAGYTVIAWDQRAFGATSRPEALGDYRQDMYQDCVQDIIYLYRYFAREYRCEPYLMGHGLGGYLVLSALRSGIIRPRGVLLSAVGWLPKARLGLLKLLCQGAYSRHRPAAVHRMVMRILSGGKTDSYRTSSADNLTTYKQDPLCGPVTTVAVDRSIVKGLYKLACGGMLSQLDTTVPYALFVGMQDPTVGNQARRTKQLLVRMRRHGFDTVRFFGYQSIKHDLAQDAFAQRYQAHAFDFLRSIDFPKPF